MTTHYQVMEDIHVIPDHFPILDLGVLPINSFVIKSREPVLVDTGMGSAHQNFITSLQSIIDPQDLRWIWITHDDADHIGNIHDVLSLAPNAKIIANSLAILRMSTNKQIPMERVHWLNPGERIHVGDRDLIAIRPPIFDNPTTICLFDTKSKAFFCGDCFGSILSKPALTANDIPEEELVAGMTNWASLDSPWIHMVDEGKFNLVLNDLRSLNPSRILSSHLPPSQKQWSQFLSILSTIPGSEPAMTPNQAVLMQALNEMKKAS